MARPRDPQEEAVVKEQVRHLLTQMIHEQLDIVTGCYELASYHNSGYEFVPIDFVGYSSMMDHIPRAAYYHLWNQDALRAALQEADMYKEQVFEDARALLDSLAEDPC